MCSTMMLPLPSMDHSHKVIRGFLSFQLVVDKIFDFYFQYNNKSIIQMQQPKPFNQRATHFIMGDMPNKPGSIYKKDYLAQSINKSRKQKFVDPFHGKSVNPPNKSSFATTNNELLKNWGSIDKASLDEGKLKQLRGHHFNLGNYDSSSINTTNKHFHNAKQFNADATKGRQQSKNKMRAHYHDFKEQSHTNFKSNYNKQFLGKEGQGAKRVKPENKKNGIVFGNHHLAKITTNAADFVRKEKIPTEIKAITQQKSSVILGQNGESMTTVNQGYYDVKKITKTQLPESTMKELMGSHFNVGAAHPNYSTENHQNYASKSSKIQTVVPSYESGSWMPKNPQFRSSTTNKRELPVRENEGYSKAEQKVKGGFVLGAYNNSYNTQFKNKFTTKPKTFEGVRVGSTKDHVQVGNHQGRYLTEQKQSFIDRDLKSGKCDVDMGLSKKDHFSIGGAAQDTKLTVYQDEFRSDQERKSRLFHKQNK